MRRRNHEQRILDYLVPLGFESGGSQRLWKGGRTGDSSRRGPAPGSRHVGKSFEAGLNQRCVVIEFDSLEKAIATYESPEYQAAKKLLDGSVERDVRMAEGA